jgi:predicted nucleotidyltransferase
MEKQQVINLLKKIKPRLQENYGIKSLALFGSYSREEQTDKSDIDLLVEHSNPLGFKYLDMIYELDKLFDKEVQVVSKNGIKTEYFDAIKADLIYV